jgi:hypothetical protein
MTAYATYTYRYSESVRKAEFIMRNQCQYTDAEIRKAKATLRKFEKQS